MVTLWFTHVNIIEYYSIFKKKDILLFAMMQINLEDIMLKK